MKSFQRVAWSLLVVAVAAVLVVAIVAWLKHGGERRSGGSLAEIGRVGDFTLVERSGRTVRREELLGKIWIVDLIFTHCAGPCPLMTSGLAELQDLCSKGPVLLVSISVDPERDTPERLSEYARQVNASPDGWLFLTGSKGDIHRLARDSFTMTAEDAPEPRPGFEILHSTRFLLVDAEGRIRGTYLYVDGELQTYSEALAEIRRDVDLLLREREAKKRVRALPTVNAGLNGLSALLLIVGFLFIKAKKVTAHKTCMLSALAASTIFLISYLYYHYHAGSVPFQREGLLRILYLAILFSHTVLAAVIVPLAGITLYHAFREQLDRHKTIARWTFPLWLYVSVTGVVVYFMLYHL